MKRLSIASTLLLATAGHAFADAAPPQAFPGTSIATTIKTGVQMAAEQVVLTLVPNEKKAEDGTSTWKVQVQADFQMRGGPKTEHMTVRFPLGNPDGTSAEKLTDFKVLVNGKAVPTTSLTSKSENGRPVAWAGFEVSFPASQVTRLRVTYTALPQATWYGPVLIPGYILETGAGWAGPIGQADVILRLPYRASAATVLKDPGGYGFMFDGDTDTTPGGQFRGNEVHWTWRNLEPTAKNNLHVVILNPTLVRNAEEAKNRAKSGRPRDLLAWAKAAGVLSSASSPYQAEFEKAMQALEAQAPNSDEARLAVLEAIAGLPGSGNGKFDYSSEKDLEMQRAFKHLEYFRRKGDARVLPALNALQGKLDHTLVLPNQRAAQSQVTPEQTLAALTRAASLTRFEKADSLSKRYHESPLNCPAYVSPLPSQQVTQRLDLALLSMGRTWKFNYSAPGRWDAVKGGAQPFQTPGTVIFKNAFTSVNSKNEFNLSVWPGQLDGKPRTFMCITKEEAVWPG
ncbi:hypothetical protein [Deinococcus sp. PESE-13]